MFSRLRHWSQHLQLASKLLPSCCALCGGNCDKALCSFCQQRFFSQRQARCLQCALPMLPVLPTLPISGQADGASAPSTASRCGICIQHQPAFDATIAAVDYAPPVDQLILALKFGSQLALAKLFAGMLRDALLQAHQIALPTLLCAVPLGRQRLIERGFNQSLEIAKPLSRSLGIVLDPHMTARVRDTKAQAQLLPGERHQNIRNGFIVTAGSQAKIAGQHIGVVDDVLTTGETLNEMAATLKRFGAARVTNFVFARTPAHSQAQASSH